MYRRNYPEMDNVHAFITYELGNDPRIGKPNPHAPDFREIVTKSRANTPAFYVTYTFDEERVYLHSLTVAH